MSILYAKAEKVPARAKSFITEGKEYLVTGNLSSGQIFEFTDDNGETVYASWNSSSHLDGGDWTVVRKPRTKPVCSHCGSDDVLCDAYAQWDTENQEWALVTEFPNYVCNSGECDGSECSVNWVPVEEGAAA